MSKKEEKTVLEKQKLELKKKEQLKKIENRIEAVKKITEVHDDAMEMKAVTKKFEESYDKRRVFCDELLKSKQNCAELKSKINKFVKQQNMLMIKLKSSTANAKSD